MLLSLKVWGENTVYKQHPALGGDEQAEILTQSRLYMKYNFRLSFSLRISMSSGKEGLPTSGMYFRGTDFCQLTQINKSIIPCQNCWRLMLIQRSVPSCGRSRMNLLQNLDLIKRPASEPSPKVMIYSSRCSDTCSRLSPNVPWHVQTAKMWILWPGF